MIRKSIISCCGLVIGLGLGFLLANYATRTSVSGQAAIAGAPSASEPQDGQTPPGLRAQAELMPDFLEVVQQADANKDNFELQVRAGALYVQISRPEKALEYFNNAASLSPTDVESIRRLGDSFFDLGDFKRSREFYVRADRLTPNSVNILTPLAVTYLAVEPAQTNEGLALLRRALSIDPNFEPALVNLGLAYVKLGDRERAREMRERLNGITPNSDLVVRLDEAMKNAPFSRR